MTIGFTPLKNLPKAFYDIGMAFWKDDPINFLDLPEKYPTISKIPMDRLANDEKYVEMCRSLLPDTLKPHLWDAVIFSTEPNKQFYMHIDPHRLTGLNIPLQLEPGKGDLWVSRHPKEDHKIMYDLWDKYDGKHHLYGSAVYEELEDKSLMMDSYDMSTPVLLNVRRVHTYEQNMDQTRVMFTLDLHLPYEEVLQLLPKEWF